MRELPAPSEGRGLDLSPIRPRIPPLLLSVLSLSVYTFHCWWHRRVVMDDPWITFRYAQQLLEGNGLVFNPGERVEGFSNPTWVLLSAVALAGNFNPLQVARFVSWLLGSLLILGCIYGIVVAGRRVLPAVPLAGFLLACSWPFGFWTMGGLETIAAGFLLTASMALLAAAATSGSVGIGLAAGSALGLLALTRPEGFVFGCIAIPLLLVPSVRRHRTAIAAAMGVNALIVCGGFLARYLYYGELLPNSVSAKVGGGLFQTLWLGLGYLFSSLFVTTGLMALLAAFRLGDVRRATLAADAQDNEAQPLLVYTLGAAILLQFAFIVGVRGDWMPGARFLVPVIPALCLLAAITLRQVPAFVRWPVVLFFLFGGILEAREDRFVRWCRWAAREQRGDLLVAPLVSAGEYLRREATPDALLAGSEAGVLPYTARLRFLDMLGLVDPHIAAMPGGLHEKHDAAYILSRQPDFIALQFTNGPAGPAVTWPSDRAVHTHPDFAPNYAEAARFPRLMPTPEYGLAQGDLVVFRRKSTASVSESTEPN